MSLIKMLLEKATVKNIAGIIGFIEAIFMAVRELLMLATRICATLIFWTDADDKAVAWLKEKFDKLEDMFENIKDFFLDLTGG